MSEYILGKFSHYIRNQKPMDLIIRLDKSTLLSTNMAIFDLQASFRSLKISNPTTLDFTNLKALGIPLFSPIIPQFNQL